MSVLSDLLPIGVHFINEPVSGQKYFTKCRVQGWTEWLRGTYQEYEKCSSKIIVEKGGTVVTPQIKMYNYDANRDEGFEITCKSNDLRTDKMRIGEILTDDGKKCISANSYVNDMEYKPNTSYLARLDTNIDDECAQGLHFYPTDDIMEKYIDTINKIYRMRRAQDKTRAK